MVISYRNEFYLVSGDFGRLIATLDFVSFCYDISFFIVLLQCFIYVWAIQRDKTNLETTNQIMIVQYIVKLES